MKLLRFLIEIFSKSPADNDIKTSNLTEDKEVYKCLNPDKIELLIKKYNCKDEDDLVITLMERESSYEEFTEDEKIFYNNPEYEILKGFAEFGFTLHREQLYGRSLAIRELLENRYQVLSDEHGNPFKEIINFTLKYFEQYFIDKPIDADKFLRDSFPTMHLYIKRQISNQQNEINNEIQFDEQNAYDEFLFFCKNAFCSLYPDKSNRDDQIKQHFKIFHTDLIQFIDAEQTN